MVSGCPSLFTLLGPNVAVGRSLAIVLIEAELEHVMDAQLDLAELRREVRDEFSDEVQAALKDTAWNSGGCASYYIGHNGHNGGARPRPWSALCFHERLSRSHLASHDAG